MSACRRTARILDAWFDHVEEACDVAGV